MRKIRMRYRAGGAPSVYGPVPSAPTNVEMVAGAGSATLTWAAPMLNEDGSALAALTQYTIYWGHVAGDQYPDGPYDGGTPDVVAAGTLTLTKSLAAGTWFAAVTATSANGESFPSGEATGVVT